MTNQHTPGPWVFAYGSVYREDTLHDENSIRIALMDRNEPHTMPTERDANARLIAAAPELLEALQQISVMPELKNAGMGTDAYHAWLIAHQAIHKAQGN